MIILKFLGAILFYSMICCTTGMSILRYGNASSEETSSGTWLATSFLLGQGILASIWTLIGLAGWFRVEVIIGVGILSFLWGGKMLWKTIIGFGGQLKNIWKNLNSDSWGWRLIEVLTALLILAGFTALGRSISYSDGSAFYMALPKVMASSHRLTPLPDYEPYSTIGLQGELHFAAMMALGSYDAPRAFEWVTTLFGAIILLAIVRWCGAGRRGQWIALTMMFTSTGLIWMFGKGKVDLFGAAMGLAAVYWAVRAQHTKTHFHTLLTGLFMGFASVAKFSYLPLLFVMVGTIFIMGEIRVLSHLFLQKDWDTLKKTCRTLIIYWGEIGFWLLIALLPHLIKNGILFGAPFAPFAGNNIDRWDKQVWYSPETTRHIQLTYPLVWFFGNYWVQYGNLSPLVLAFLPLAFLLPRPSSLFSSRLASITIGAAVSLLVWWAFQPSIVATRYILTILLLFIPISAKAAEYVVQKEFHPRWLTASIQGLSLIIIVVVSLNTINFAFYPKMTLRYLAGIAGECERDGVFCDAMQRINWKAVPGTRVFNISWYRYWLRPDLLQCISNRSERELFASSSPDERWLMLYQHGFSYLFTDRVITELDMENPPAWLNVKQIFKKGNYAVYNLNYINPPEKKIIASCTQVNAPGWQVVFSQ